MILILFIASIIPTLVGMIYFKSINPFYAWFTWSHYLYWYVLTKGKMYAEPNEHKYLRVLDKISYKISRFFIIKLFDTLDHDYFSQVRYQMKWQPLMGDIFKSSQKCPVCGAQTIVCYGIYTRCENWQHPYMPDYYQKNGKRNCDYGLMGG